MPLFTLIIRAGFLLGNYKCGMNDRISASCENASSATLIVISEGYVTHETFSYMLKRRKHLNELTWPQDCDTRCNDDDVVYSMKA